MPQHSPSSHQSGIFDTFVGDPAIPLTEARMAELEAIKHQLSTSSLELKILALSEALSYGKEGVKLVVEIVQREKSPLQWAAYDLLWEKVSPKTRQKLLHYKTHPIVLIVDDSLTIRELVRFTLENNGYRVKAASNGQEAWKQLSLGMDCDLVLCDSDMPKMDGYELIQRIQEDPELCHLPTVFLDSQSSPIREDWHERLRELTYQGRYLVKPWQDGMLLEIVNQAHRFQQPEKNYRLD